MGLGSIGKSISKAVSSVGKAASKAVSTVGKVASSNIGTIAAGALGGGPAAILAGTVLNKVLGGKQSGGLEGIAGLLQNFLPADVLGAATNVVGALAGNSVNQALQTLQKEFGLPKFMMNDVQKAVGQVLQQLEKPVAQHIQSALNEVTRGDFNHTVGQIAQEIVKTALDTRGLGMGAGGDWRSAVTNATSKVLGDKVTRMAQLSGEISKLSEQIARGEDMGAGLERAAKQKELQGISQELSGMISAVVKGIVDSVGMAVHR